MKKNIQILAILGLAAILLVSCSKADQLRDTDWYGADLRLHFGYLSTVTMETSNGYSYTYPKWEGTYSSYIGSEITIRFSEYQEKLGKSTYLTGMSVTASVKGNTLTFHWEGKDWVFTKMKK